MSTPEPKAERLSAVANCAPSRALPRGVRSIPMALWQITLGIAVLLMWQGASGRLVDNFFISNPIDVGARLYRWTMDGSIFGHISATIYATALGFIIGSVGGAILGIWLGVSPFASRVTRCDRLASSASTSVDLPVAFSTSIARACSLPARSSTVVASRTRKSRVGYGANISWSTSRTRVAVFRSRRPSFLKSRD